MALKIVAILDDVTGPQHATHNIYLILYSTSQGSTKGEIFSKYCEHNENPRGGSITPLFVPRWGYDFACTSEG